MANQRGAGSRAQQEAELNQRRTEQLERIRGIRETLGSRFRNEQEREQTWRVLDSVSQGLYDEMDKLSKKAPADTVTDRALRQVNDVIKESKDLLPDDGWIQRLNAFVPAGDNPQHRDVVLDLRQVRQGLERNKGLIDARIRKLSTLSVDASGIQVALEMFLSGDSSIDKSSLKKRGVSMHDDWMDAQYPHMFDFERLDGMELQDHFERYL